MRLWSYIDRNHERLGITLFVIPAVLLPVLPIVLVGLIKALTR